MRPSWSSTKTVRLSTQARTATGSEALGISSLMVLMVGVLQLVQILEDQLLNPTQILGSDAAVLGQKDHRNEPELAFSLCCSDMDMRGLVSLV